MSRQRSSHRERVLLGSRPTVAGMSVVALAWAITSCGSPTDDGPPPVAKVIVTSPVTALVIGETTQLSVKLEDNDGNLLTNRSVSWSSSNNAFARVSPSGLVSGEGAGDVTITATSEGKSGSAAITIHLDACGEALPITVAQTVTGRLSLTDCELNDESMADRYALTLDGATPLQIDLWSEEFDAFLAVTTPTGSILAFDDNGAGLGNARIDTTLAPGSYIIWANSVGPGETGAYTLSLGLTAVAHCASVGHIAVGQSVAASLADTDCLLGDATYADGWELTLSRLIEVAAELRSNDPEVLDPFVLITDAQGNRVGYDDDGGGGRNSRLELALGPGTYHVWANTFYPGQTGHYSLSLENACKMAPSLPLDETSAAELSTDDCRLDDGSFSDRWSLTVANATTIRLDLISSMFDPYLILTDASGDVVASDDDGGSDLNARVEATLPAGTYIVWANTFAAGQTGAYSISATVASPALNLHVDGLYATQAIQRFAGTVPLVKDQGALVRVFGRANVVNTTTPAVRVRVYHGGILRRTLTVPAPAGSVPTVLGEGTLGLTWNVQLDGADVQPGLALDAEIDPDGVVTESDETDNLFPLSGTPKAIDVRDVPRFDVTFVPIRQSVNGLVGNVTQSNVASYLDLVRRVYPLNSVDVTVRAEYTTTLPALRPQDENHAWGQLLGELNALRLAENPSRSYFGVVNVAYGSGIGGLGFIGTPTALARDEPATRGWFTAHELGHNLGRLHAPCGGAGSVDPDYPYPEAAIGVFGYDRAANTMVPRTTPDLMSYCRTNWVSDYTYEGVLAFRAPPVSGTQAAQPVLLVWGTVDGGNVILEPAFQIVGRPSVPHKAGPWSLVARDVSGGVVFSYSFDLTQVGDAKRPSAAFAFALPMDSQIASRVHSLRLTGPEGQAERGGRARVAPAFVGRERSGDRVTMRWNRDAFPAALLRDTRTGRILSIVRNGELSVRPDPGLELVLSDGVRTIRERVDEQ